MEIETVKKLYDGDGNHNGHIINGVMAIPLGDENRHRDLVSNWVAGGGEVEE